MKTTWNSNQQRPAIFSAHIGGFLYGCLATNGVPTHALSKNQYLLCAHPGQWRRCGLEKLSASCPVGTCIVVSMILNT